MKIEEYLDGNMTLPTDHEIGPFEDYDDRIVFQLRKRTPEVKAYFEVTILKSDCISVASYEHIAKNKLRDFLTNIVHLTK